jgi:hypothetical protein
VPVSRIAYGLGALALLAAAVVVFVRVDAGWWVFLAFGLGPDLAFLAGIGQTRSLARGQMAPRAVPLYNALHRVWGPLALGLVATTGVIPPVFLVGALTWGVHVFVDRAIGYGLRTPDGWQRT